MIEYQTQGSATVAEHAAYRCLSVRCRIGQDDIAAAIKAQVATGAERIVSIGTTLACQRDAGAVVVAPACQCKQVGITRSCRCVERDGRSKLCIAD